MASSILKIKFKSYDDFDYLLSLTREYLKSVLPDELMIFESAIVEAVNNAIIHGNSDPKVDKHSITLTMKHINSKRLIARVKDNGKGFNAEKLLSETSVSNKEWLAKGLYKETGRGILIMIKTSDYIKYNRKGNEVLLVKKLP